MTKHQLRLLLCAVSALALMAYSMFAIDWFRIVVESHAVGLVQFDVDLRAASACFPTGACASVPLSMFQGGYSILSVMTFYGSCALGGIIAYQTSSRLFKDSASESLAQLGYFLAVGCFCAAGLTGYLFQPEVAPGSVGPMAIVSTTIVRTWAPAILVVANALGFVSLHFATSDASARRAPVAATSRRDSARQKPPVLALLQDQEVHADPVGARRQFAGDEAMAPPALAIQISTAPPESIVARAKTRSAAPSQESRSSAALAIPPSVSVGPAGVVDRRPESTTPLPAQIEKLEDFLVLVEDEEKIPAIESAIAELAIESLMPPTPRVVPAEPVPPVAPVSVATIPASVPPLEVDGFLTVKSHPSFALLRGKLSFATTEVALSTLGIDAKREDGITKVVPWDDVVGVVARRLPPMKPYDGETFVDVVSTAGSTLRILPWTELTGDDLRNLNSDTIERARALVQLVASRCPTAQVDNATRSFLGGRGQAAQLPNADLLAQHDERLS